jgi:hypothetical protein
MCVETFAFWQEMHWRANNLTCFAILGQQNFAETKRTVASTPGWAKLCVAAISVSRMDTGTNGLNTPPEISPLSSVSPIFLVTTKRAVLLHMRVHSVHVF